MVTASEPTLTPEEQAAKKAHVKEFTIKSVKFIGTQVGLMLLIAVYAVIGGLMFQHLESENETQTCIQMYNKFLPLQNSTVYKFLEISNSFIDSWDKPYALQQYEDQLSAFRTSILQLGYDGTNCSTLDINGGINHKWNFWGSLLFATTIFTTVGYGNIAPKTFWGRMVCIAYGVLGIPLMMLSLANIGEIMAKVFRYAYVNIMCCGYLRKLRKPRPKSATTKDKDDITAWQEKYSNQKAAVANPKQQVVDDDEEEDDLNEDELEMINVPITVSLLLVAGYVIVGAMLFGVIEGWSWLKSAYYCFVTISTIGFGDIVPGNSDFGSFAGQMKMFLASIYMILGMAILSMAFQLIQDEMMNKFIILGEKLGICRGEEEEPEPSAPPPQMTAKPPMAMPMMNPQMGAPAAMGGNPMGGNPAVPGRYMYNAGGFPILPQPYPLRYNPPPPFPGMQPVQDRGASARPNPTEAPHSRPASAKSIHPSVAPAPEDGARPKSSRPNPPENEKAKPPKEDRKPSAHGEREPSGHGERNPSAQGERKASADGDRKASGHGLPPAERPSGNE